MDHGIPGQAVAHNPHRLQLLCCCLCVCYRFYHRISLVAASFCILVPILQLNGRLGQAAGTEGAYIAPYEYAGDAHSTMQ
jgi:hypothetical protein